MQVRVPPVMKCIAHIYNQTKRDEHTLCKPFEIGLPTCMEHGMAVFFAKNA